jgi:hypothetical protein
MEIYMKKTILIMIMICILSACDYGPEVEKYSETKIKSTTEATTTEVTEKEKPPEIYKDLEIKFKLEKTSYGSNNLVGIYKNNSEYAITKIEFKVLFKDNNITEYIDSMETVLPGETSPEFDFSLIDDDIKESTIEVLEANITIKDNDGNERHIRYDNKLKIYEYTII